MGYEGEICKLVEELKLRRYSGETIKGYSDAVTRYLKSGKTPREFLLSYYEGSKSAMRGNYFAIKFFYENALRQKFDEKIPIARKGSHLPVVLGKEEVCGMLDATINLKHRLVISLLYYAGLRLGEAMKIKWQDIDFGRSTMHIKKAKGDKDRIVFLHEKILQIMEENGIKKEGLILMSERGSSYNERTIQEIVKAAARKAGIKKQVTPHTLRHCFATHLLEAGADIRHIQKLLGHSDMRTTMVYLHVAQIKPRMAHSPLDSLYNIPHGEAKL